MITNTVNSCPLTHRIFQGFDYHHTFRHSVPGLKVTLQQKAILA